MKNTIIQRNCRGLRDNYDELQLLLNDYDSAVVCLQATYLKEPNHVTFRNYNILIHLLLVMGEVLEVSLLSLIINAPVVKYI